MKIDSGKYIRTTNNIQSSTLNCIILKRAFSPLSTPWRGVGGEGIFVLELVF